ncbi:MAG TPA: PDZ domain-containing protein, partial [Candidatus Saccharimonadales bacterium]|nr:PDZ domain-containing protein [Candidatus Saccharimonadales bacterium]
AWTNAAGRVVGVTFTLKLMEVEPGVEGPEVDGILCGVVGAPGMLIVPGDIYPEPGGDPKTTMIPADFKIHLGDDKTVSAEAAGLDRKLNLAFLKFDPSAAPQLKPVAFAPGPKLRVGDSVILVGLMGRKYDFAPSIFQATINSEVKDPVHLLGVDTLIQDLTVGGLVLRRDGTAAGLVVKDLFSDDLELTRAPGNLLSIIANTGQPAVRRPGYAMILPGDAFAASLASPPPLDLGEKVKRAWLGIVMQALDDDLRDYWHLPIEGGILIGSVVDKSPAEAAGIRQGDIITRFNGDPIHVTDNGQLPEFRRKVERMAAGDVVPVQVYRDGHPVDLKVKLGEAPATAALAETYEDKDFGLTVREITIDIQQAMNLDPDLQGVVIEDTESSGWADVAGLAPQDIILAINGVRIHSVTDVRNALADVKARRDPEVIFFVMRPPDTLFIRVRTEFGEPKSTGASHEGIR